MLGGMQTQTTLTVCCHVTNYPKLETTTVDFNKQFYCISHCMEFKQGLVEGLFFYPTVALTGVLGQFSW